MNARETVESVIECLARSASVETVYGEPITTDSRMVVPVARVAYGFGGGKSSGDQDSTDTAASDFGGGGGVIARPVGALEITDASTRFVRFSGWHRLLVAFSFGLFVGFVVGRRR